MLFKAMLIALTVSSNAADVATTRGAIGRGCVEANPMMGSQNPSAVRLVLLKAPSVFAMSYVGVKLSKHHPKAAAFLTGGIAGGVFTAAAHNMRCGR